MEINRTDMQHLAQMSKEFTQISVANEKGGHSQFVYYVPVDAANVNVAKAIFKKYGIIMQECLSGHNNNHVRPALRIALDAETLRGTTNLGTVFETVRRIKKEMSIYKPAQKQDVTQVKASSFLQQRQIAKLLRMTGRNFQWQDISNNPLSVNAYVYYADNESDAMRTMDKLRRDNNVHSSIVFMSDNRRAIVVVENEMDVWRVLAKNQIERYNSSFYRNVITQSIGKVNGHDVYLEILPTSGEPASFAEYNHAIVAVVNINGGHVPFYMPLIASPGRGGRWRVMDGVGADDAKKHAFSELDRIAELLDKYFSENAYLQKAQNGLFLHVNEFILKKIISYDFPLGLSQDVKSPIYSKNATVYLPKVMRMLRAAPRQRLRSRDGGLLNRYDARIDELQRMLDIELFFDDNHTVHAIPNRFYPNPDDVKAYLHRRGLRVDDNLAMDVDTLFETNFYNRDLSDNKLPVKKIGFWQALKNAIQGKREK